MAIALPRYLNYGNPIDRANPLMRGLVSRWKVVPYYSGGGRFIDLAGKNHGTLTNAPTWSSALGRPGGSGSLSLTGGSSQGINCGTSTLYTANNKITISCWVNPGVTTRGDLVTKWLTGNGSDDSFDLLYGLTSGKPQFYVSAGVATINNSGAGSTAMAVNTWNHVVGVFDAVNVSVYLNGILGASAASTLTMPNLGTRNIQIGRNSDVDGYYTGKIDDVSIFNRAYSASEVLALYNATRSQYDPTLNWYSHPMMMGADAAPGGFKAYWARPRTRIIGGGVS